MTNGSITGFSSIHWSGVEPDSELRPKWWKWLWNTSFSGLLIFRGKKSKISRDFKGQIRGKIGHFRGENKSKFPKKSADFAGVYQQKAKFRRIFRGKFAEKSADFTGNFGGKLRQETISKKQPISLDFFWQISLKSINFASIWPALFNVFLTGIIICSLNKSSLEQSVNAKAINIMVSAQFFATFI